MLNTRRVFSAFWVAYLLSYLFRTVNAVISPELTRDLALGPGSLGLLTSAYFVAFAAVQLPAGMLLDRYGPRRVESALLVLGGDRRARCSRSRTAATGLVVARALIGAGVAVCLMAPLKAIAAWYAAGAAGVARRLDHDGRQRRARSRRPRRPSSRCATCTGARCSSGSRC